VPVTSGVTKSVLFILRGGLLPRIESAYQSITLDTPVGENALSRICPVPHLVPSSVTGAGGRGFTVWVTSVLVEFIQTPFFTTTL
jgi:hypothetical protein